MLLAAARDAFPVDHGRIDLSGEPAFVLHPVMQVGALVTYELSAEDRFQEEVQRWVDVPSRRQLPADLVGRLNRADVDERAQPRRPKDLMPAVGAAHRLIDAGATTRRQALAAEVSGACQAERGRAVAYYADAVAGIKTRLANVPSTQPDRRAALEQRLHATREEEARRLAEIAEKYEARHTIRPYRLHVMLVPALRVPGDVLRGTRRYPTYFDWLLPAGAYAPTRCPSCGGEAPLVAGKLKLGCETCLPPKPAPAAAPAAARRRAAAAPGPVGSARPVSGAPRGARPAPAARPVPPQAKRRAVVPPKVRKEQQKATATLAERLWCAVAADDRRIIRRILHPARRPRRSTGSSALPGSAMSSGCSQARSRKSSSRRQTAMPSPGRCSVPPVPSALLHLLPGRAGGRGAPLPRRRRRNLLAVLPVGPALGRHAGFRATSSGQRPGSG